jgi:hypothetical protein
MGSMIHKVRRLNGNYYWQHVASMRVLLIECKAFIREGFVNV